MDSVEHIKAISVAVLVEGIQVVSQGAREQSGTGETLVIPFMISTIGEDTHS
jgi:hypothetical protein